MRACCEIEVHVCALVAANELVTRLQTRMWLHLASPCRPGSRRLCGQLLGQLLGHLYWRLFLCTMSLWTARWSTRNR